MKLVWVLFTFLHPLPQHSQISSILLLLKYDQYTLNDLKVKIKKKKALVKDFFDNTTIMMTFLNQGLH